MIRGGCIAREKSKRPRMAKIVDGSKAMVVAIDDHQCRKFQEKRRLFKD
jgi:hypothetical protein